MVRQAQIGTGMEGLTNPAASKLDALSPLHGGLSFGNGVVLHKAIGVLEGDLGEPSESVEDIKHLTFCDAFAGEVSYTPL